jgi:hypothetical protein
MMATPFALLVPKSENENPCLHMTLPDYLTSRCCKGGNSQQENLAPKIRPRFAPELVSRRNRAGIPERSTCGKPPYQRVPRLGLAPEPLLPSLETDKCMKHEAEKNQE